MASTYENDLRLQEIGTGEQSGTWGVTTNTNLELVAQSFGYSATGEAVPNASAHTITLADGVADEARSLYLKLTGGGQACTVTLAPNTVSKVWMVENTTSHTLTFSQGSGANVAVLAGQVKIIGTNGVGGAGAVFDLMQDLAVPDLFVDDDITMQSDGAVLGLGADKDVTLTHVHNTGLLLNSTMALQFNDASQFINAPNATTLDINATDEIELNATLVDVNANLDVSGTLTAAGNTDLAAVEFNSLSGTGSVAITDILDQDNMSGNSATALATQQSIKAYVDSQVGTVDTLTEVLANGNTTATDQKIQFRDTGIFINSSADGQLDIVADTEIQIAATTIDINGAINASGEIIAASLDISGNIDVDGVTNLDVVDIDGAVDMASTLTVAGVLTGASLDISGDIDIDGTTNLDVVDIDGAVDMASTLTVAGAVDFNGNLDVDGTTNLDVVDIDGAVDMASTLTVAGVLTGASLDISGNIDVDGVTNLDVVDIDGAVDMASTLTVAGAVDFNGNLDVDGVTNLDVVDIDGAVDMSSTLTVAGVLTGASLDISGDIDVDGTTNLDVVDIDGAVDMASTLTVAGVLTGASLDISGDIDVDGTTNLDVVDIDGAVNMATTALVTGVLTTTAATVFNGGFTSNAACTITTADNLSGLIVASTDADAQVGPTLQLKRNSGSPADADNLGNIIFVGENDADEAIVYGNIGFTAPDVSDGTEDGLFFLNVINAGTERSRIFMNATETVFNEEGLDLDFRVESDGNANMLFVDGGNNKVGIGTSSPTRQMSVENTLANGGGSIGITSSDSSTSGSLGIIHFGNSTDSSLASIGGLADGSTSAGALLFKTEAAGGAIEERMRIDSSGNVGIGCVPNSIQSGFDTLQIGGNLTLNVDSTGAGAGVYMGNNVYRDSTNSRWEYINTDEASQYYQANGTHVWRYAASGSANAAISWSEAMRIDSGGNLLVGTTTSRAGSKIVVDGGAADTFIHLDSDSFNGTYESGIRFSSNTISGTNYYQGEISFKGDNNYSGDLTFSIAGGGTTNAPTERMRIKSNARICINGSATTNGHGNFVGEAGANSKALMFENTVGGGETGSITTGSSSTAYNTSSDYRLKENVVDLTGASARLNQLDVKRFNFIADDTNTLVDGFLAHEVATVVPEAIHGTHNEVDDEDNAVMQGIDQSKLVPLLTAALQEALAKIDSMESRLTALEG